MITKNPSAENDTTGPLPKPNMSSTTDGILAYGVSSEGKWW